MASNEAAESEAADSAANESTQNIVELSQGWLSSIRSRAHITTELALAEAKLAVTSVAAMVLIAVVAAILLLSAWGLAIAGLVIALMQGTEWPLWTILAGLAVIHVIAAVLIVFRALALSENLQFSETRAQFEKAPDNPS